jgi:signal transduction histidine kinase
LNILNNSIQSIADKGEILIETKRLEHFIAISINDSGSGISKENISKIVNPFYTTKQAGEGTGLGLSITFAIIKDHKGSIEFESEENEYTTVIVKLPINRNQHD